MRLFRSLTLLLLSFSALAVANGLSDPLVRGQRPDWVRPLQVVVESRIPASEIMDGYFYTLVDEQCHVERQEYWSHYAYRIDSELGVQNNSELRFTYAPEYEAFSLTGLRIWRDGEWLDGFSRASQQELREETQSRNFIYDGRKTVLVVLEDIRPGDVVEYDYLIKGGNPIFEGKFHMGFSASLAYELKHASYRVLSPESRPLRTKVRNVDWSFATTTAGGITEYRLERTDIPGDEVLKKTPSWYFTSPYLELSEWKDWSEVNAWGTRVFAASAGDDLDLAAWLPLLPSDPGTREARLREAVRFVQNSIRYLGVEIGVNSHKPHAPRTVMKLRYGDCKDKALLLVGMARSLGYEAWPVLVDTDMGEDLDNYLPSPQLFNHAIALVRDGDGTSWYIDATNSHQGGTLASLSQPDYGKALVLNGSSGALVAMPPASKGTTTLEEVYDSLDPAGETKLDIVTTYKGSDADRMRYYLASNSITDIQENYLDYYKEKWPRMSVRETMSFTDDLDENVIKVTERYQISGLWDDKIKDKPDWEIAFYPYILDHEINGFSATDKTRTHPLGLSHPRDLTHKTTFYLPGRENIEPHDWSVDNSGFAFSSQALRDFQNNTTTISLNYHYETKVDQVAPADAGTVVSDYLAIQDEWIGFAFRDENGGTLADSLDELGLLLASLVIFGLGFVLGRREGRKEGR